MKDDLPVLAANPDESVRARKNAGILRCALNDGLPCVIPSLFPLLPLVSCVSFCLPSLPRLAAVGSDEAGDTEVGEDEGHYEEDQEMNAGIVVGGAKVGAVRPHGTSSEECEDAEEGAGDLKPEDAGELGEGSPKGFSESLAALSDAFAGLADVGDGSRCCSGCRGGFARCGGLTQRCWLRGMCGWRGLARVGSSSRVDRRREGSSSAACTYAESATEAHRVHG